MARTLAATEFKRISVVMAFEDYRTGRIRLARTDVGGFTHLVATRKGLFVVRPGESRLLAGGMFFGLTVRGNEIFLFQHCDLPHSTLRQGRIIRLKRDGDAIVDANVVATGLDNGCHQIDFIGDRLCIADTYNQQIVTMAADGSDLKMMSPLPLAPEGRWPKDDPDYFHANSLLAVGDRIFLLLHNHWRHTERFSEVLVCDAEWKPIERLPLRGRGCHDFALLEDGTLLVCDSEAGDLISLQGLRVKVSPFMTRGLSVGADSIVVGASRLANRETRIRSTGTVTFVDREYRIQSVLELAAAPMSIKRMDGLDGSISGYLRQVVWGNTVRGEMV